MRDATAMSDERCDKRTQTQTQTKRWQNTVNGRRIVDRYHCQFLIFFCFCFDDF